MLILWLLLLQTAPTAVMATLTPPSVLIEWTDASAVETYRIERQTAGGTFGAIADVSAGGRSYLDSPPLISGTTYGYRIRAILGTNVGAPSATASVTYWEPGTGIGVGPIADRPATCTPAVGWWALDEGVWWIGQPGPDGLGYRCEYLTALWTPYYIPFINPHPATILPVEPELPPQLISLTPDRGTRTQAIAPALFVGEEFNAGGIFTGFTVEITGCTGVTVSDIAGVTNNERTANFNIAPDAAGLCSVAVRTPAGVSNVKPFLVAPPVVTGISPAAGPQGQTVRASISGAVLDGAEPRISISGDDVTIEDLDCPGDCSFDVVIPFTAALGIRNITFSSFDGVANPIEFRIDSRAPPSLTSITPGVCDRAAPCPTTFEGVSFIGAALLKLCPDSVMSFRNPVIASDTLLTADISVPLGPSLVCPFVVRSDVDPELVASNIAAGESVGIPPHRAGDFILIFPYRGTGNTGCTPAPGWTPNAPPIAASQFWMGLYSRTADSDSTVSGTWGGCTLLGVTVVHNQGVQPAGNVEPSTAITTNATYPANNFTVTDGSSIAVAFGCTRANSAAFAMSPPAGMINLQWLNRPQGSCGVHLSLARPHWAAQSVPLPGSVRFGTYVLEVIGRGLGSRLVLP